MNDDLIKQAADAIDNAKMITVFTGAGVSKESGVPTFRDAMEGLWAKYDPQELATPIAFMGNPKLVWDWYEWRRELVGGVAPNPGHHALAKLHKFKEQVFVITQNVDDLHEQAGSKNIVHLHGNIATHKCFDNCQGTPTLIDITKLTYDKTTGPPDCPYCGAHVRPNVVWFGERLPADALYKAQSYSQQCDVMIVVGTSGLVSPAAELPRLAKKNGATIIEVNPDYSMITRFADIKLEAPSGVAMPKVIEILEERHAN
ncbi:MAG: NAD-dependent deacylase [Chloroflexota bacterium]